MRAWKMGLVGLLLAACGTEERVDPVGRWAVTLSFTDGNCFEAGATVATEITVVQGDDGFLLSSPDPSAQFDGSLTCDGASCRLSTFMTTTGEDQAGVPFVGNWVFDLTLDDAGQIAGDGSLDVDSNDNVQDCAHDFTATGELQ